MKTTMVRMMMIVAMMTIDIFFVGQRVLSSFHTLLPLFPPVPSQRDQKTAVGQKNYNYKNAKKRRHRIESFVGLRVGVRGGGGRRDGLPIWFLISRLTDRISHSSFLLQCHDMIPVHPVQKRSKINHPFSSYLNHAADVITKNPCTNRHRPRNDGIGWHLERSPCDSPTTTGGR